MGQWLEVFREGNGYTPMPVVDKLKTLPSIILRMQAVYDWQIYYVNIVLLVICGNVECNSSLNQKFRNDQFQCSLLVVLFSKICKYLRKLVFLWITSFSLCILQLLRCWKNVESHCYFLKTDVSLGFAENIWFCFLSKYIIIVVAIMYEIKVEIKEIVPKKRQLHWHLLGCFFKHVLILFCSTLIQFSTLFYHSKFIWFQTMIST